MKMIEELEKQLQNHYRGIETWTYRKIIAHILSRDYADKDMKIDFSNLGYSKFGKNGDYASSHQGGEKYSITFCFGETELAKYETTTTSLPEFIRRMINAKTIPSASLCSSYLILYLSYQLKANIKILETVRIYTYSDLISILRSNSQEDLKALVNRINKNFPEIEENPFNDGIPVGYSVDELKQDGWSIQYEYGYDKIYDKYIGKKENLFDINTSAFKLNQVIEKTPNLEYDFLFKYRRDADSLKIRKWTTKIKIVKIPEQTNSIDALSFEVTTRPLFLELQKNLEELIDNIFKSSYMEENRADSKLFWGRVAKRARTGDHTFELTYDEKKHEKSAIDAKLIEKAEGDRFKFCGKHFRILLDGIARGQDTNHLYFESIPQDREQIIENVIAEIIDYGDPFSQEFTDHRNFRLTEGCIFAVALVSSVGLVLQEKLIFKLCEYAENYSLSKNDQKNLVTSRLYQHLCALIVSYMLLVLQRELKMNVMKRMYNACFQKQLYPAQVPIWESLKMHSEFYKKFAFDAFQKSLKSNDNDTMSGQPYFHFLQPLCREPAKRSTLLDSALLSQKQSWIYPTTFNKETFQTLIKKFKTLPPSSPKEIIASQLALYSLADIRHLYNADVSADTDSLYRFLEIKDRDYRSTDDALLRATILSDYFQRTTNPAYRCLIDVQKAKSEEEIIAALKNLSSDNVDFTYNPASAFTPLSEAESLEERLIRVRKESLMHVRKYMLLVCGSLRMICTYDFKSKFNLNEQQLESYKNWIDNESSPRFYFMLLRLVSFTNFFQEFGSEYKEKFSSPEVAQKYDETTFLPYDNFPTGRTGFSEFRSEIEGRINFKLT